MLIVDYLKDMKKEIIRKIAILSIVPQPCSTCDNLTSKKENITNHRCDKQDINLISINCTYLDGIDKCHESKRSPIDGSLSLIKETGCLSIANEGELSLEEK